ncbi:MAG: methionyl-tRNA formyltransferase [Nitrospirae bacterium]|nr:methionyl-tRNA formyltransferase [Nitrospirota bacterium]
MRIVFIGSTVFGLRCLKRILRFNECNVAGIVTTRETFTISSDIKEFKNVLHADFYPVATKYNIPVFVMEKNMTNNELVNTVKEWKPDFIFVVGWYHIIPNSILKISPTAGLHASLLPDYSGWSPLVWAIINGEHSTGITLFMFDDKIDNGNIIGQKSEPIHLNDTIVTLYKRIEDRGLELIDEFLPQIVKGVAPSIKQDDRKRRIMPIRRPEDGEIKWNWSAFRIYNFIRAQTKPYPGAYTYWRGNKFIIFEAKFFDYQPKDTKNEIYKGGEIITIIEHGYLNGILVATANNDHPLLLTLLGCEDLNLCVAAEYAKKNNITVGEILGD